MQAQPFLARDGRRLALHHWPAAAPARGSVVLVHGLGEHAGRYDALARWLNVQGWQVWAHDQYGHGRSEGVRGTLTHDTRLLDDLADLLTHLQGQDGSGAPWVLLGHSMGGLVAARFVALNLGRVDALVLSSPAFDPGLNPLQKLLLAVLPRLWPQLCVGNGLQVALISHDPEVVRAYGADPLVHDRVSGRLARFIAQGGAATVAAAAQWRVPTLLLYAGADRLVNPAGSRAFAAAAPAACVTAQGFDGLYHELFNEAEPGRRTVLRRLQDWLGQTFP